MIFVVGHKGRVGGFLYDAYQRSGLNTTGIGRDYDYSATNFPSINGLSEADPHCIIYAALSSGRPYTSLQAEYDLNTLRRFIDWTGRLKVRPRLVFLSSISVYENLKSGQADTSEGLTCSSPYARMKLDSESLIKRFRHNFLKVEILRCGALLVDPKRDESFVGRLVTTLKDQKSCELVNSNNRFNALITAQDLFSFINKWEATRTSKNFSSTYNIGSTEPLTMSELAEHLASRIGVTNSVIWREDPTVRERILTYPSSLRELLPTARETLDRYISQLSEFQGG